MEGKPRVELEENCENLFVYQITFIQGCESVNNGDVQEWMN